MHRAKIDLLTGMEGRIHARFVKYFYHLGTRLGQYMDTSGCLVVL